MNIAQALELEKVERFEDEWNGTAYWFEAKRNSLTPKLMQRFADFKDNPIEMATALGEVLTGWSIDWEGKPFPPVADNLAIVPVEFLGRILEKIGESWSGNAQKPSQSQSGSAASAK